MLRPGRVHGDLVDHAADRVGAVEHRSRPANDFDPAGAVDVGERGQLAEILLAAAVVETDAVFGEQDPLAPLASHDQAGLVRAHARDVDTGKIAEQVGDTIRHFAAHGGGVEHQHWRRPCGTPAARYRLAETVSGREPVRTTDGVGPRGVGGGLPEGG